MRIIIHGDHCVNGYLAGRGSYLIEIKGDRIYDTETGERLYLQQVGNDCPVLTNGCWEFWPDDSEMKRLGLVPTHIAVFET